MRHHNWLMKPSPAVLLFPLVRAVLPALCGLLTWACLGLPATVHADSIVDAESLQDTPGVKTYGEAYVRQLTRQVDTRLAEEGVQVAILARAGRARSEMPDGIDFTHCGIALRVEGADPEQPMFKVYNLYQGAGGDKDVSELIQDYTIDMVAGAIEPEIGIIIPTAELQKKIAALLDAPLYSALHNPDYNLIANPFNDRFDNCVTHTLEVVTAALLETEDTDKIAAYIRTNFEAQRVRLSFWQRVGSNFMSGVNLDDQDGDVPVTATFTRVRDYLALQGHLEDYIVVGLTPPEAALDD